MRRAALLLIAIVLVANAPLLDDFARLLGRRELAASSADATTHFFRMLEARDLYLPSGHRLGWEPFWFQGYVPFLLYPHLTYILLALLSIVLPVDPARIFNVFTVVIYFALPLSVAWPLAGSRGVLTAGVIASWLAVMTTMGAGLSSVFQIGLLSQQVGTILFGALAYDLIVADRVDRAAIWLGLLPLVHVHASVIAAVVWVGAALLAVLDRQDRKTAVRTWITSSILAALIASPTAIGLFQGWNQVGSPTAYGPVADLSARLLSGRLLAPWPTVVAMCVCLAAATIAARKNDALRFSVWLLIGLLLCMVSLVKWDVEFPLLERLLNSMLYLRTLSFAFVWMALLALSRWDRIQRPVQALIVAFSVAGIVQAWPVQASLARQIGSSWQGSGRAELSDTWDYHRALDWIDADVGKQTATLAIVAPRGPVGHRLFAATHRTQLPILGGHGMELTRVRNVDVAERTVETPCRTIRRQVRHFAVGYVVGGTEDGREHLEECLRIAPSFTQGNWWVLATGKRWGSTPRAVAGFGHDATWTQLEWELQPTGSERRIRLPVANVAPWEARVDGKVVVIESTDDHMMRVTAPVGGKTLRLRYAGYAGEWWSVGVALVAMGFAVGRVRYR